MRFFLLGIELFIVGLFLSYANINNTIATIPNIVVNNNSQITNSFNYEIGNLIEINNVDSICLPIKSLNPKLDSVIGFDFSLKFDSSKVYPNGRIIIGNELINKSFVNYVSNIDSLNKLLNVTIYLNSTGNVNTFFKGKGELACVVFKKANTIFESDTANFYIDNIDESYNLYVKPNYVKFGKCVFITDSIVNGKLKFWSNNNPIAYNSDNTSQHLITNIYGCNKKINAVQPNLKGEFYYNLNNGNTIEIIRDIYNNTIVDSVINTTDALLVAKISNRNKSFIPSGFQIIASDVNFDNYISAGDVSQINLRYSGKILEFKQNTKLTKSQSASDWVFIDSAYTLNSIFQVSSNYPYNNGIGFSKYNIPSIFKCLPIKNNSVYKGVLIGDVNGSYALQNTSQLKSISNLLLNNNINTNTKSSQNTNNNISILYPANGATFLQNQNINISLAFNNLNLVSVNFYIDDQLIETDNSYPYSAAYKNILGVHSIYAKATDFNGNIYTTPTILISVNNNIKPNINITNPSNASSQIIGNIITITAQANDADGYIQKVEFKANNISLGIDSVPPYQINWRTTAFSQYFITAIATDNNNAVSSDSVQIYVTKNDTNYDYEIGQVKNKCFVTNFCLPVYSVNSKLSNVIGYDIVLKYDANKVTPTGKINISNDLVNSNEVNYLTNIDSVNSTIDITLYLNTSANANSNFKSKGQLFCAEFNKTSNFKSTDTAFFSILSLDESYFTYTLSAAAKPGMFISYPDSIFNGTLKYWADSSVIGYNDLMPNEILKTNITDCNKISNPVFPNINGVFNYNTKNGSSINITRDVNDSVNVHSVITAHDAYLTALLVNNKYSALLSAFQIIAMDVNFDGVVNNNDITQICQRAIGISRKFEANPKIKNSLMLPSDWLFVNSTSLSDTQFKISTIFPLNDNLGYSKYKVPQLNQCLPIPFSNNNCPIIGNTHYYGILLGDIDVSNKVEAKKSIFDNIVSSKMLNDNTVDNNNFEKNNVPEIFINLSGAINLFGRQFSVPLTINTNINIHSIDFDLHCNNNMINNLTFNSKQKLSYISTNYHNNWDTYLNGAYNISNSITKYSNLYLTLTTNTNEAILSSDFSASNVFINGKKANIKIDGKIKDRDDNKGDYKLNAFPCPAREYLNIVVSHNSTIQIFNSLGCKVYQKNVFANIIEGINIKNYSTGIYSIKAINQKFTKVIIILIIGN